MTHNPVEKIHSGSGNAYRDLMVRANKLILYRHLNARHRPEAAKKLAFPLRLQPGGEFEHASLFAHQASEHENAARWEQAS